MWVGVMLAVAAAVLLAFVPRLPSSDATSGLGLCQRRLRIDVGNESSLAAVRGHADRGVFRPARGRRHAVDHAVCVAERDTGFNMQNVLALHVPVMSFGRTPEQMIGFTTRSSAAYHELPGVERVAVGHGGAMAGCRSFGPGFQFSWKDTPSRG